MVSINLQIRKNELNIYFVQKKIIQSNTIPHYAALTSLHTIIDRII